MTHNAVVPVNVQFLLLRLLGVTKFVASDFFPPPALFPLPSCGVNAFDKAGRGTEDVSICGGVEEKPVLDVLRGGA